MNNFTRVIFVDSCLHVFGLFCISEWNVFGWIYFFCICVMLAVVTTASGSFSPLPVNFTIENSLCELFQRYNGWQCKMNSTNFARFTLSMWIWTFNYNIYSLLWKLKSFHCKKIQSKYTLKNTNTITLLFKKKLLH